jgi:DNA-binding XRE family transcriptional regulator
MDMELNIQKLRQQRESRAWTQSHLAEVADISLRTIQRIEKSGFASPESTQAICSAFQIKVGDILSGQNEKMDFGAVGVRAKKGVFGAKVLISSFVAFVIAFTISFVITK